MRTNLFAILFAISLIAASNSAYAGFWTSTKLMQHLEEDMRGAATYDVGLESGYIMGIYDVADGVLVCAPDGVSLKQVKMVVFNHMKEHPELWSNFADQSVIKALQSTWPCAKK